MKADLLQGGFICFAYALNKRSEQKRGGGGIWSRPIRPSEGFEYRKNKKGMSRQWIKLTAQSRQKPQEQAE